MYITSEVKLYILFIIQTSDRMQYITVFQDKLHSVNIQDDQAWTFSETVQKISKVTYTASRFLLLTNLQWELRRVFEWTLHELRFNIKKLLCLFFFFNGFLLMTMCNLKKRLIRAAFWVLLQPMLWTTENKRHSD